MTTMTVMMMMRIIIITIITYSVQTSYLFVGTTNRLAPDYAY